VTDRVRRSACRAAVVGVLASVTLAAAAGARAAPSPLEQARPARADSSVPTRHLTGAARSPSDPPLAGQPTSDEGAGVESSGEGGAPQAEADPLVSNGLGSPLCRMTPDGSPLPAAARHNCETSGFVASAAQTGDFGLDVHIDTGVLGLSSGGLLTAVQDLCVTPLWMALVWAVHALLVMLEWCFTLDLLDSASVQSGLARGLRQMQSAFTVPWLATVLATASVLTAYNGLVRRRVAETLGHALLALAMMAGGFWVMLDPTGTVGALGAWANQASLGTLATTAHGAPNGAARTLAQGMSTLFSVAIEVPWCYLEFGDVGWCRDPARLDPHLRAAALAIAREEAAQVPCASSESAPAACPGNGEDGASATQLRDSASLLRSAQTNGAIFLALPANGSARNSINDQSSLLSAICRSETATSCSGTAAAEAEFRTNHGTWPRVGGLLLILAGVLGMLLLLGFIALRLLTAALFSLLCLMLAPVAVLAPALGEVGRAAFRRWSTQLLGAVVSKLLFSLLLGAVLVVLGILADLEALGWWTQWLLMSAFWWSAFVRRHQLLALAGSARTIDRPERRALLRRVGGVVEPRRRMLEHRREARERRRIRRLDPGDAGPGNSAGVASPTRSRRAQQLTADRRPAPRDAQARRVLDAEQRVALARVEQSDQTEQQLAAMGSRLERVRAQGAVAQAAGDVRRTASLARRGRELEASIERRRIELIAANRTVEQGAPAPPGRSDATAGENARARFLDVQAALPGAVEARRQGGRESRDYAALAGLVGYGPREFHELSRSRQRATRVAIDRELALRKADRTRTQAPTSVRRPPTPRATAPAEAAAPERRSAPARRPGSARPTRTGTPESRVMRDVREVEAGRKRQLGYDQP
jgi:hypothetical protein